VEVLFKKYILFLAIIVAAFVGGFFLVGPLVGDFMNTQSEISSKKEKIADLKNSIKQAEEAKRKAESKQEDAPVVTKLIYESAYNSYDRNVNFNAMLESVLELSKQAGLKVKTIEFKDAPESDAVVQNHGSEYEAALLAAQFIGTYTQFQTFMRDVYRHQYLMGIKDFKIVPYEFDKKVLIVDMSLSLYMKK